ncbi:MAG: RelA/SpoT domain-containing protein [Candidatus Competibacteraceae bacterium]|nr:RelA/SpoT domain-containing protein [Candidatus Competibacteraceae bacterium]
MAEIKKYPGGSKNRVNRAGENLKNQTESAEDHEVFDAWRSAHRFVLNSFQAMLRTKIRGTDISFAQRHKRKRTIIDKLSRLNGMQLSRMDDVAGCRLIFPNIKTLYSFRTKFHHSSFNHILRNEVDKYDYIKNPKATGYRGIHDIYIYNVRSKRKEELAGLQIEIQYRTLIQHYWATTNEIIGFITESQPKFQRGDKRYQIAMTLASEILARVYENSPGPYPRRAGRKIAEDFLKLDDQIGLMRMLKRLNAHNLDWNSKRNTILIFGENEELQIKTYRDSGDAIKSLFRLEREFPQHDVVLVKADTGEDIKMAFKNYFTDAKEFIKLIEKGCRRLQRTGAS